MRYCGVAPARGLLQLALLEEVRDPEPPIRLVAVFFEPGTAEQLAAQVAALDEAVVALGAPIAGEGERACDALLAEAGVPPAAHDSATRQLAQLLAAERRSFAPPPGENHGAVAEGAYQDAPVFETSPDGVFCALQGRRLPARRHPHGVRLRIQELLDDHVEDDGGELWHRRIEEVDAVAAALCAHRYAVGHACWVGNPDEAVVVLPGSALPERFSSQGVIPPVERLQLPEA